MSGSDASLLGVLGNTSLPRALGGALFPNEKEMRKVQHKMKNRMDFPHHENTVQAKLVQEEYSQSGEYCQYEANTKATLFFSFFLRGCLF